jgi:hypothetical protein
MVSTQINGAQPDEGATAGADGVCHAFAASSNDRGLPHLWAEQRTHGIKQDSMGIWS